MKAVFKIVLALAALLALVAYCVPPAGAAARAAEVASQPQDKPLRIASLNLCTDHLLLRLADRDQIASLSFLSADQNLSLIADEIEGIPLNYGQAEDVRLLRPDLVLAGTYGSRFAVAQLKARGVPVLEVPPVMALSEIAPIIEELGAAIGEPERGAALAASVRAELAALATSRPSMATTAVVFQPRGFAAGPGSLADDVLKLAGARNLAVEAGVADWVPLGVEALLRLSPDLVVIDSAESAGPSLAHGVLKHRALRFFTQQNRLIRVPSKYWGCGTEQTPKAVRLIRDAFTLSRQEASLGH